MIKILKVFLVILLIVSCAEQSNDSQLKQIIKDVKNAHVKDSRLEYVNIDVDKADDGTVVVNGATSVEAVKNDIELKMAEMGIKTDIALLPDAEFSDNKYAIMKLSVIPIRRYPRHSAEQIDQSIMGAIMTVYQKRNGWYLIQTDYNYFGWVPTSSVILKTEAEINEWKSSNLAKYNGSFEFVTEEKNGVGRRLVDVGLGNVFQLVNQSKNYAKIKLVDGREGYISNNIETYKYGVTSENPDPKEILSLAKTFLGLPYLWGGNSTKGVDCSGFTQSVFKNNGLLLPRDADQQSFEGEDIKWESDFSNVKSGDLLFFGPKKDDIDNITHVAISMGGYMYIHSSGEVKINSFEKDSELYNDYLLNNLRKVRRVIK